MQTRHKLIRRGQYWFRYWLSAWRKQAITCWHVDSSSKRFCCTHLSQISQQKVLCISIRKMGLKNTHAKLLPHFPGQWVNHMNAVCCMNCAICVVLFWLCYIDYAIYIYHIYQSSFIDHRASVQCMMTSSNDKKFRVTVPSVRGIQRSPVNSPHKGQWRGALMFS